MNASALGRFSSLAKVAFASSALLALAGCAGGLPDVHSISALSFTEDGGKQKDAEPSLADLVLPGALDDIAMGKANAPVTVIQYVSLNCTTCGKFQEEMLPKLKKAFIDKGKARFVFREFPEDGTSEVAAAAVRCTGEKEYLKAMEKVMAHQKEWVGPEANKDGLFKVLKFTGLKREKFDACLADKTVIEGLVSGRERAKGFGVTVSPTFFVNGKKVAGAISYEELHGMIEAAFAATQAPAAAQQPAQPKPKA